MSDESDRVAAEQSIRLKEDLAKANKELSDIQADYDYNKTLESLDKQWLWYYLGYDFAMLQDTTTPDGYQVGSDGAWIKVGQVVVENIETQ